MDQLENLISQNILIKVESKTVMPEAMTLKGSFKIHVPLNLIIAYVHEEDKPEAELVQTFVKLNSVSIQYKIIQEVAKEQIPKLLHEGTSTKRSSAAFSTSLLVISGPRYTDLLSNRSMSSIHDIHLDMQRCVHYDFELTVPLPLDAKRNPLYAEFTLCAFCSREGDSMSPRRHYLYLGPRMKIPLFPEAAGGYYNDMIIAAAKPPYLIRAEIQHLKEYVQQFNEIELFYGDTSISDLPTALRLQHSLLEYRDLCYYLETLSI